LTAAINIKDAETDRMVRQAAARRNQPIAEVIKDAVRALEAEKLRARQERDDRIMAATQRAQEAYAANPPPWDPHEKMEEIWDDVLRDNGLFDPLGEERPAAGVREDSESSLWARRPSSPSFAMSPRRRSFRRFSGPLAA